MTKLLLIETCTERGLIAFAQENALVLHQDLPQGLRNSSSLLPAIERALDELGWAPQELDALAVSVGPGSYTGIRVGAAVAQAMAFARKLPLVGVCSLRAYVPEHDGPYAAVIDAKIGGLYVLCAERHGDRVRELKEPQLVSIEQLPEHLGAIRSVVTPKIGRLEEKVKQVWPDLGLSWAECAPDAHFLVQRATEKLRQGEYSEQGRLELLYLRKTQAEIEQEATRESCAS
jgi:tRNA threonylcarbamoyl adenosine modification protein YeaZ